MNRLWIFSYSTPSSTALPHTHFGEGIDTYDAVGNRLSLTSPAGTTFHTYDAMDRMLTVQSPIGHITTYFYDATGNRTRTIFPNGNQERLTYDRLHQLRSRQLLHADRTILSSDSYTRNATGRITRVIEQNGRIVDYHYDRLHRLSREAMIEPDATTSSISYMYDHVGNRLKRTDASGETVYSYDANDRMLTAGTQQYIYDDNGNLIEMLHNGEVVSYAYDEHHRLMSIHSPHHQVHYIYNPDGDRIAKAFNGHRRAYVIDRHQPFSRVLETHDEPSGITTQYTYGISLVSRERDHLEHYYHADHLRSIRGLSDVTGSIIARYDYEAFGEQLDASGAIENPFQFAGEYHDATSGLYDLRARYYHPEWGRFLSLDPAQGDLKCPLTLNPYLYALADPVNRVDPSGLASQQTNSSRDFGNHVHRVIGRDFTRINRITRRYDRAISETLDPSNTDYAIDGILNRLDLVDLTTHEVYEIKSIRSAALGRIELRRDIYVLNRVDLSNRTFSGHMGNKWVPGTAATYTPPRTVRIPWPNHVALVNPPDNGLIIYCIIRTHVIAPDPQLVLLTLLLITMLKLTLSRGFGY